MTKDEALKLALKFLESMMTHQWRARDIYNLKDAIKEALAQPEQELVEWGVDWGPDGNSVSIIKRLASGGIEVVGWEYAPHPPQRTWVGLTDDDKVLIKHDANFNQFMTAGEYADRVQQLTEARLKDLNT